MRVQYVEFSRPCRPSWSLFCYCFASDGCETDAQVPSNWAVLPVWANGPLGPTRNARTNRRFMGGLGALVRGGWPAVIGGKSRPTRLCGLALCVWCFQCLTGPNTATRHSRGRKITVLTRLEERTMSMRSVRENTPNWSIHTKNMV